MMQTIIGTILENAKKYPDKTALVSGKETLTYSEMIDKSLKLAHLLKENGVEKGDRVGICLPHNEQFVLAILAVLINGASYVPIDEATPNARMELIIEQSGIKSVVTMQSGRVKNSEELVYRELVQKECYSKDEDFDEGDEESEAYVIFKSGSTGNPKGIPIRNKSVLNLVNAFLKWMKPSDYRILLMASFCFDMSVFQMFYALMTGQTLDVLPQDIKENPLELLDYISEHEINVMELTPLYLDALSEVLSTRSESVKIPKIIISSGEALPIMTAKTWFNNTLVKDTLLLNCYGPTETCVYATVFPITSESVKQLDKMFIGSAIEGMKIYALDENKKSVGFGKTGELYISGPGLSKGYVGLPELNSETFVKIPEIAKDEFLYKTGDFGYINEDGTIFYQGRSGDQVKIHGYRVELGDIQSRLGKIDGIKDCRVIAQGEGKDRKIVAYIETDKNFTPEEIDEELSVWLPHYMIPALYVPVKGFEKTDRGKLNKKALPDYRKHALVRKKSEAVAEDEKMLALVMSLISSILNDEDITADGSMLEQGGTSLHFFSLSSKLLNETGVFIRSTDLMKTSSIVEIANLVTDAQKKQDIAPSEGKEILAKSDTTAFQRLLFTEEKKTRRLIDKYGLNAFPMYNVIYRVKFDRYIDDERFIDSVRSVIKKHDALQCFFERDGIDIFARKMNDDTGDIFEKLLVRDADDIKAWKQAVKFFDIEKGPLFKLSLLEDNQKNQTMICNFHHAVFDYCSMRIFMEQVLKCYEGKPEGESIGASYLSFMDEADKNVRQEDIDYWKTYYEGRGEYVFLPGDISKNGLHRMKDFSQHKFTIDGALFSEVRKTCHRKNITTYAFAFSCFARTIMDYLGKDDIIIGTYMNNRDCYGSKYISTIGLITTMIGIRFRQKNRTMAQLISDVSENLTMSLEHLALPYHKIHEALSEEDQILGKLYEMTFNYILEGEVAVPDTDAKYDFREIGEEPVSIPFAIKGFENQEEIVFRIKYCSQIYSEQYVRDFTECFMKNVQKALESLEGVEKSDLLEAV